MPKCGSRVRIRFQRKLKTGIVNDGHWILKPHEDGWRLTYSYTNAAGERISHGTPIDGTDPLQGVEMMMGLIHQEIMDTHQEIADRVIWMQDFPAKAAEVVVDQGKTLNECIGAQIRSWHNLVPPMVDDYKKVILTMHSEGWPLMAPEPFPWEGDPSLIPHRNAEFQQRSDVGKAKREAARLKAAKARAKRKKAKRSKR